MKLLLVQPQRRQEAVLSQALRHRGHDVTVVEDAGAACACQAAEHHPLVVLDADALGGGAAELCRRLRAASQGRVCMLLAVTARHEADPLQSLLAAGADDCLTEPADDHQWDLRLAVAESRLAAARSPRALQRSIEEGCCALVYDVPYGVFRTSAEGKILEANPALVRILGYDTEEELLALDLARDVYRDPVDREELLAAGGDYLNGVELDVKRKDGTPLTVRISGRTVHDEQGAVVHLEGIVEDITEQKRAERALRESESRLRESESRYRLIAENVTDLIWTARPEGLDRAASQLEGGVAGEVAEGLLERWQFTYVSPSVRRFLGYDVDEALRLSLEELLTPDSYQLAVQVLAEELACEQQGPSDPDRQRVLELEHRTQGGSICWGEVTTTFLRDEKQRVIGILGVTRDITDRKQAEEALRESESTLRNLIENMPDLVFVVDWDGVLQYVNRDTPAGSRRDLVGKSCYNLIQPQYQEQPRKAFAQARQSREAQQFEVADVFDLWWSCRVVPVIEDDEPRRAMLICTDVTQRRRAQERVLREQELLRQLLELHERDRELLAFELHDGFAQLLTGAMLNFEAAAQLQPTDPEKASASFQSGTRLLGESISESRRLVSGLRPPVLDQFGIVPAVEQLVIESQTAGKQQIDFISRGRFQRLARPVESAIFRIVQETLTNARRHSQSQKVRLELSQDGSHVCVMVRDWGVGFDPDRVDENCFGLKGIRERARLLGGQATIQTAPGSGTCVTVKLPQVPRARDRADRSGEATTLAPEPTGRCGEDAG